MTRSHKIGWLVLVFALLFALWRLPRLHGQGFGSFSHDQPFLAADTTSSVSQNPPMQNLQAWWHWADNTNGLVNSWTDRISGFNLKIGNTGLAPTNDGTGIYFSGTAQLTNEDAEVFHSGHATYVLSKLDGIQTNINTFRILFDVAANPTHNVGQGLGIWQYKMSAFGSYYPYIGSGTVDPLVNYLPKSERFDFAFSILGNYLEAEGWLNGKERLNPANVYELTHDNWLWGNSRYGTNSWNGWIYDILVYTNIHQWSTSSVPAISNVYAWSTNRYPRTAQMASGVVGHWNLDEASGTRYDSTTNDYDLTSVNSVGQGAGIITNAGSFVAASVQYLTAATSDVLAVDRTNAFSVSFWCKLTNNASYQRLVGHYDVGSGTGRGWAVYVLPEGNISTIIKAGADDNQVFKTTATRDVTNRTWFHFAMTWDGSSTTNGLNIYTNGVYEGFGVGNPLTQTIRNTSLFTIGAVASDAAYTANGLIDQVTIWNRKLSSNEVFNVWAGGAPRNYPAFKDE